MMPQTTNRRTFLKTGATVAAALSLGAQDGIAAPAQTQPPFRFVHLTDMHVQPELAAAEGYRQCIAKINQTKTDRMFSRDLRNNIRSFLFTREQILLASTGRGSLEDFGCLFEVRACEADYIKFLVWKLESDELYEPSVQQQKDDDLWKRENLNSFWGFEHPEGCSCGYCSD